MREPFSISWLRLDTFRSEHPEVNVHTRGEFGVYYADAPAGRTYGRTLAEFLEKLRRRFPAKRHGG